MARHQRGTAGLLFRTLLFWTLVGLCCTSHRVNHNSRIHHKNNRTHHNNNRIHHNNNRIHHRGAGQRVEFPSLQDQGVQRVQFPSQSDDGVQRIQFPSQSDEGGSLWSWLFGGQKPENPPVKESEAGAQIQKCASGFYRDSSGSSLGRCVSCDCNGLSEECEDGTGKCLNCRYNTAGWRCDRCRDGYYGNAAQRTCRVCPCPFPTPANSFAASCRETFGDVKCFCKSGYAGESCERCAPGYHGDPLRPGGSCRPCNCLGNGNNCDQKTGVCKSSLEPGDTNTEDSCKECDNCAQTLLDDLEKLDEELGRIKSLLDNATAGASASDRLRKLEKSLTDAKALVKKLSSSVNDEKSRVNQLEEDMNSLEDDIDDLKDKAGKRAADADKAVANVNKTHKRANDLDSEIKNMLKKIQALLDLLKTEGNRGDNPNTNLAKLLEEAERLVDEMEDRNFTPQKTAAEKERDEAKKLLDNIQTNITKQSDQNEAMAGKLKGLLNGFQDKLKDLDKALKEATDSVKTAKTQNGLNAQTLADMQKRVDEVKKEQATVQNQMTLAEKELQKTEDLEKKLSDSKTEYERLAAQLDGARRDVTKKVNSISQAVGQKDLVESAEEHAKKLQKLAQDVADSVNSASDRPEVRNAKDAIDAYKNITESVNAAQEASKKAKDAADAALKNVKTQRLPERAKDLKETAEDLLRNAQDAQKDSQDAAAELPDLRKRLTEAEKKKADLEKSLKDTLGGLNTLNKDDVRGMIDEAKRKAAEANNTAGNTMKKLNDIRKEIDGINISPTDSNLGGVLDAVDQSVKNLWSSFPSLTDKISAIENLTSQFLPLSNISSDIRKIKELIQQTRDAANRIVIPMNFVGDGHVELRPPQDLEELKAYTSLSLSLQRPQGRGDGRRRRRQAREKEDYFVMYLGDRDSTKNYLGMALRNNVLYGVYKLNGVEYEMKTDSITKSSSDPSKFDRVDLRRIYQDAEMILTKDATSPTPGSPVKSSRQGEQSKNLLDLSPEDLVFYVGGYPDDFTPPPSLKYSKYKGCIEFSSFNDKVVSLYNFKKAVNINSETPCKRYIAPEDQHYYEGTGFGRVLIDKSSNALVIGFSIYSHSENGLLTYLGTQDKYFIVTMEKGVIYIHSDDANSPATNNMKIFPTADWTDIQVIATNKGKLMVRTDSKEAASVQAQYSLDDFKDFYIGGAPRELRERGNFTMQPFKGCLKNLKVNKDFKPVDEQVGISRGCPREALVPRKAEFSADGSLSAELAGLDQSAGGSISLGFKTSQQDGALLQHNKLTSGMSLAIKDGRLSLHYKNKVLNSNKKYNDGQWHYVTVTRTADSAGMMIDDEDEAQQKNSEPFQPPRNDDALQLGQFQGCLSNLYTRRPSSLFKPEDLSSFTRSGDVLMDVCTPDSLVHLMMDRSAKRR